MTLLGTERGPGGQGKAGQEDRGGAEFRPHGRQSSIPRVRALGQRESSQNWDPSGKRLFKGRKGSDLSKAWFPPPSLCGAVGQPGCAQLRRWGSLSPPLGSSHRCCVPSYVRPTSVSPWNTPSMLGCSSTWASFPESFKAQKPSESKRMTGLCEYNSSLGSPFLVYYSAIQRQKNRGTPPLTPCRHCYSADRKPSPFFRAR